MTNILSGLSLTDMLNNTTTFIGVFAPYATMLIGVLLAFFIIDTLVSSIKNAGVKEHLSVNDDFWNVNSYEYDDDDV